MADINYAEGIWGTSTLKITDPEKIPAGRYYDEAFFKLECEYLWSHAWQMACRLEQIPNVGNWIDYEILGKSVIVVRTAEGVKAFHNHCRHRGVPLTEGSHGNCKTKGFICPFHGWRWNMEGECTFVYGKNMFSADLLEKDELALRPCRVELWGGCAFINFDDDAPSYRESIGPVGKRLEAHGAEDVRAEWWYATVLPANWKIAMEAFMEGYHVMKTHPQLQQTVPMLYNMRYGNDTGGSGVPINPDMSTKDNILAQFEHLKLLNSGMAGMVTAKELDIAGDLLDADLPANPAEAVPLWYHMVQEQITKRLRAAGGDVPDLNAVAVSHPVNAVEFLFPNYFLLPFFTGMSSYRIRPLGPESCLFEIWSLVPVSKGEELAAPMEPIILPYDSQDFPMIPRQDYSNIPLQQKGMHSKGLAYLRLAKNVEGLISNYQRLIDGYIERRPMEQLARANQVLGGNFDGKIADLGF
jgi:nitrite reductase/ring-hydroxylating ferredoxin subunit